METPVQSWLDIHVPLRMNCNNLGFHVAPSMGQLHITTSFIVNICVLDSNCILNSLFLASILPYYFLLKY